MRVAITGATGFVGGALARVLAEAGHEIAALTRLSSDRSRLRSLPVRWIEGDISDPASLAGAFCGADWLIHAAGRLGAAGVPESDYQRLHVDGTRHVLDEARRTLDAGEGCRRILYVSSPGVLGPIAGGPADETTPLAPSNPYERSKAAAEQLALEFAAGGLPLVVARPEFIYGPGDRHVLGLFRAVQRGLFFYVDDGRYTCHPTFIADALAGMLAALEAGTSGEIYHITGPRPVTFRELGETIAAALEVGPPRLALPRPLAWAGAAALETVGRLTGWTPPLSRTGVAFFSENRRFSWQKARDELGYAPQVELQEGVARTVAWYQKHNLL